MDEVSYMCPTGIMEKLSGEGTRRNACAAPFRTVFNAGNAPHAAWLAKSPCVRSTGVTSPLANPLPKARSRRKR